MRICENRSWGRPLPARERASSMFVLVFIAASTLGGCTSAIFNRQKLQPIKSVALVGYSIEITERARRKHPMEDRGNRVEYMPPIVHALAQERAGELANELATRTYDGLARELANHHGWRVLPKEVAIQGGGALDSMRTNTKERNRIVLAELPSERAILDLPPSERVLLAQELGVDAIAAAQLTVGLGTTDGFLLAGFGSMRLFLQASWGIHLMDGKTGDVIWRDTKARGDPEEHGILNDGGAIRTADFTPAFEGAAAAATETLLRRYVEKTGSKVTKAPSKADQSFRL